MTVNDNLWLGMTSANSSTGHMTKIRTRCLNRWAWCHITFGRPQYTIEVLSPPYLHFYYCPVFIYFIIQIFLTLLMISELTRKEKLFCVAFAWVFPHKVSMTRFLYYMQNTGRDFLYCSLKCRFALKLFCWYEGITPSQDHHTPPRFVELTAQQCLCFVFVHLSFVLTGCKWEYERPDAAHWLDLSKGPVLFLNNILLSLSWSRSLGV